MTIRISCLLVACAALCAASPAACAGASREARIAAVESRLPEVDLTNGIQWDLAGLPGSYDIAERMKHHGVPGLSVAVIDNFEIVWAKGYGVLAAGGTDSVTTETLFEAASTTKAVTAVEVMRLVSKGRLGLDDDVNRSLTSWKVPETPLTAREKVTIRRLLSHTAGINRPDGGFPRSGSPTLIQVIAGEPPAENDSLFVEYEPGSRFQYSNFGFILLQQAIEDVTGKPYAVVMRDALLEPLKMSSSTFDPATPETHPRQVAKPHNESGEPKKNALNPGALANGGLLTTPSDLARLAIDFMKSASGRKGKVLPAESARLALETQIDVDPAECMGFWKQGLGMFILPTGAGPGFCQPGFNMPGATCLFVGFPEAGKGAVIMTNSATGFRPTMELLASIMREYGWPVVQGPGK